MRARGHIWVLRRPYLSHLIVELDPAAEFAEYPDRNDDLLLFEPLSENRWQNEEIHPIPDKIAKGRRADQRQIKIGSGLHSIIAKRICEPVMTLAPVEWLSIG